MTMHKKTKSITGCQSQILVWQNEFKWQRTEKVPYKICQQALYCLNLNGVSFLHLCKFFKDLFSQLPIKRTHKGRVGGP